MNFRSMWNPLWQLQSRNFGITPCHSQDNRNIQILPRKKGRLCHFLRLSFCFTNFRWIKFVNQSHQRPCFTSQLLFRRTQGNPLPTVDPKSLWHWREWTSRYSCKEGSLNVTARKMCIPEYCKANVKIQQNHRLAKRVGSEWKGKSDVQIHPKPQQKRQSTL